MNEFKFFRGRLTYEIKGEGRNSEPKNFDWFKSIIAFIKGKKQYYYVTINNKKYKSKIYHHIRYCDLCEMIKKQNFIICRYFLYGLNIEYTILTQFTKNKIPSEMEKNTDYFFKVEMINIP